MTCSSGIWPCLAYIGGIISQAVALHSWSNFLSPCIRTPLQRCARQRQVEDWYLLHQMFWRQPPFDPLPHSPQPPFIGSSGSTSSFPCCGKCASQLVCFVVERNRQLHAMVGSSCRSVCLVLAFYFALKSSVCVVMSDFHKQVLLQAKSCCVFDRGGLLVELGNSSETGRVGLDWFLCLQHNWLWRPSGWKCFQANMRVVLRSPPDQNIVTSDGCFSFPRISAFILLRAWLLWQRRAFSISTFLFFS